MNVPLFLVRRMPSDAYVSYLKSYPHVKLGESVETEIKWVFDIVSRGYRGTYDEISKSIGKSWWSGQSETWIDSHNHKITIEGKKEGDEVLLMKFMASCDNPYHGLKWKNGWSELCVETPSVCLSFPFSQTDIESFYNLVTLLSLRKPNIVAVAPLVQVQPKLSWATGMS
jgi:hypothetical protein